MKFYVSEKVFSLHNKFYVKDEKNEDVYEIASKFFSFGDKTAINDRCGNRIVYIEQRLFHITPCYNVYIRDEFVFKITKKFQLFKNDYVLSNGYRVEGDFLRFDFIIYNEKNYQIGNIKRDPFSRWDEYEINIDDIDKKEIILAIVVAIVNDLNRRQPSSRRRRVG